MLFYLGASEPPWLSRAGVPLFMSYHRMWRSEKKRKSARQDAHRSEPRGYWANLQALQVILGMGDRRKGLMVGQLVPGGGIIEGKINDYIVGSDGRLTKRRRAP